MINDEAISKAYKKGLKETINWRHPELLAVSEHVLVKGKHSNRNGMIRQLVLDKALALGVVDENEHKIWSLIADKKGFNDE